MSQAKIRIITRGDDSGSCHSANKAILDAFQKGVLRNTSIMAPAPMFFEAAELYKDVDGLCVGLHGTLNDEWNTHRWGPVLGVDEVPSLVMEDGTFFKSPRDLWANTPNYDEILAELKAQLELARSTGLKIDYIDSHMAYDWFDGLLPRLHAFANAEGLIYGSKQWDRLPQIEGNFTDPVEQLVAELDAAESGKTYLMVAHPCYDTGDIREMTYGDKQLGEIAKDRDWERRLFMDSRVVEYFDEHGVEAVRFTDLDEETR